MTYQTQSVRVRVLVVYSRSQAKLDAEKRQAEVDRLLQRRAKIQGHLNQRQYKRREYTLEQIHLAQRGNAAKPLVDVELGGEEGALTLTYQVNAAKLARAQQQEGRYPSVTDRWEVSADEVLQRMKEQDLAEKRLATVKGPLQIHPLWLHKDERLVSLVLIVMLALLVYCLLEHLVRQAQYHLAGRTILETFAAYTVVLLQFADGSHLWTYPELTATVREACELEDRILISTRYGAYPHTDGGVEVRRLFHKLRSLAIENFNEHFKGIFDGHGQVPTRGLTNTKRFALGAIFVYQLALLYRFENHLDLNVGLKAFLKAA